MATQKERIEQELRGEPTGFDILVEGKKKGIAQVRDLVTANSDITRREISKATGFSMRTISRYLVEVRKIFKKGIVKNQAEIQKEAKEVRIKKLRKLIYQHPDWNRDKLAAEVGIARRTLVKYLREM